MKLTEIPFNQLPRFIKEISDYRQKLQINSANLADLIAFAEILSNDDKPSERLLQNLQELDATLSKAEMTYVGRVEEQLTRARTTYNINTDNQFPFYTEWVNNALEFDAGALNHIVSVIEHKVDHRYPVLNLDSHSKTLVTSMSPADPHYVITKPNELSQIDTYSNTGFVKSLQPYEVVGRFLEVSAKLPQGQFNLILTTQIFSVIATMHLLNYLNQCFKLLRPGGILLLSFVDVLSEAGYDMFCKWIDSGDTPQLNCITKNYLLEYILKPSKEQIPFIIDDVQTFNQHTVMVLKKSGNLRTVKNRKTVGSIKMVGQ